MLVNFNKERVPDADAQGNGRGGERDDSLQLQILRSSGFKALHDEEATFAEETEAARLQSNDLKAGLDWYGFTLAFKSVLLEGPGVAFIGATAQRLDLVVSGAAVALLLVLAAGILLH